MYRGTFIDSMGRKRERMGFYGLNKPNLHRCSEVVLVEARNKVSAANKTIGSIISILRRVICGRCL